VTPANEAALRKALEAAGVEFIDENGGGAECASESGRKTTPEVGGLTTLPVTIANVLAIGRTVENARVEFHEPNLSTRMNGWG
jgi:hypothetical protein